MKLVIPSPEECPQVEAFYDIALRVATRIAREHPEEVAKLMEEKKDREREEVRT